MTAERTFGGRAPEPTQRSVAEQLWHDACRRAGSDPHPLGPRYADLLATLHAAGPGNGSELTRRIGDRHQPNTTHRLRRLHRLGLVTGAGAVEHIGSDGRPRRVVNWSLTPTGRELAGALVAEQRRTHSGGQLRAAYLLTEAACAVVGTPVPPARPAPVAISDRCWWPTGVSA